LTVVDSVSWQSLTLPLRWRCNLRPALRNGAQIDLDHDVGNDR